MATIATGIDVSEMNGFFDWNVVQPQIDFAILRAGFGKNTESQDDDCFEYNASECQRLGIPFGVSLYSYAASGEAAESEALHVLRLLDNKRCSYPVYYDMEDENTLGNCSNALLAEIAERFCGKLERAGYVCGIFAGYDWFQTRLASVAFACRSRWLAYDGRQSHDMYPVAMRQCGINERLQGVPAAFGFHECYVDFPNIMITGNHSVCEPGPCGKCS
ncbi:MAG: hypothetical protein LBS36_00180 [Oscillospiraceae bacterium]|nr:hypothetical protein [Oscillospiraceae bacterium]